MKTTFPRESEVKREWLLLDATDKVLGRLAVKIADTLRGRDKPTYSPHVDTGNFVIVVNAEKVRLTGKKEEQKIYQRYSGWRGGLKEIPAGLMRRRHPEWLITLAVRGMLPRNHLRKEILRRLKVYAGPEHPHSAQKPHKVEW
ncbi:MAG: 50S ribosomal protein L13 [Kiritimatiellia bacterium]